MIARKRRVVIKLVSCVIAGILSVTLALHLTRAFVVAERERNSRQYQIRGIYNAAEYYAQRNGEFYPRGLGVLIWDGSVPPEWLVHAPEDEDAVGQYDWGWDEDQPRVELDGFAAAHSRYVVLVWGAARTTSPDTLFAYAKLDRTASETQTIFSDGTVREIPIDEAVRLIRAAGHEPVWADEPED